MTSTDADLLTMVNILIYYTTYRDLILGGVIYDLRTDRTADLMS